MMRAIAIACLVIVLNANCRQAAAQQPAPLDRAMQILEMQLNSRATRPAPPPMSGRDASHIYEGAFGSSSHDTNAAAATPPASATGQ